MGRSMTLHQLQETLMCFSHKPSLLVLYWILRLPTRYFCWFITAMRYSYTICLSLISVFLFIRDRSHPSQRCINGEVAFKKKWTIHERHSWRGWGPQEVELTQEGDRWPIQRVWTAAPFAKIGEGTRRCRCVCVCGCVCVCQQGVSDMHGSAQCEKQREMWYTRTSDQTYRPEISKSRWWQTDIFSTRMQGSMRGFLNENAKHPRAGQNTTSALRSRTFYR